jgi:hypothetical protein
MLHCWRYGRHLALLGSLVALFPARAPLATAPMTEVRIVVLPIRLGEGQQALWL